MYDDVDPFIGTDVTSLHEPTGLAATWWWPKPQSGNTHPGATIPFGMVSACAFSGAYPTGYGCYDLATEGVPQRLHDRVSASGFTHFQQSGTGAIRKYYNYVRVTPMLGPLDELGVRWSLDDETASPGYYAATLESGIRCELTVGPRSAVHRYTFPDHRDARIVVDCSQGGLEIAHGQTVPLRASLHTLDTDRAHAELVVEGAPLAAHFVARTPGWRSMLWYDRRLMPGGSELRFDHIRPTTLRPFGLMWRGPVAAGQTVEVHIGFSLRGTDQAADNLERDMGTGGFEERSARTRRTWRSHLGTVRVDSPATRRTVMASSLYRSLIKPCFAHGESPFWPGDGPFVFDICTMWDIYRTQLPLIAALFPQRASELANALLHVCEEEGNLPIGYRMARGADRFSRQGSALAHTFLADLNQLDQPGVDWEWALAHMHADLRRAYGEDYLERGIAHPISHTLDLAGAYVCTATVARSVGDERLAGQLDVLAESWRSAFDPATGLLVNSTFYEGGRWNYSFRIVHDMAARIALAGGDRRFVELLDGFFGVGAPPVKQLGEQPSPDEVAAGMALDRFEGLNNEPDMDAPWAYHYAGRPDRTAEVIHAAVNQQFGTGRGGLPGNDDSGGLSSWYVWASLGLFPVAGQNLFLVNAPSFAHAELDIGDEPLAIDTVGFVEPEPDRTPSYVRSVRLDGRSIERSWLSGEEIRSGRQLTIEVAPTPGDWATRERPPSASDHS